MNLSKQRWRSAILSSDTSIKDAISNLNKVGIRIIMIVNKAGALEGTISDGDLRRYLLKGLKMTSTIESIIHRDVIVVSPDISRDSVIELMVANKIQQVPIVDENKCIVGLHLWDEIMNPIIRPNIMVIMAGGRGKRLYPYTAKQPKPLLAIGGKPMLEHIIERAKREGFNHFVIAIHYLGNLIEEYFGDGGQLEVKIEYLREELPLGTAGALSLLNPIPDSPFIVTNGDVITDIRYGDLLDFHINHGASATMAVRVHEWHHPFGVVHTQGVEIVGFEEKPIAISHINAGVYALDSVALKVLADNKHCDMPTLFDRLKEEKCRTIAYPMHEPWLDVGRPDDLVMANKI